MSHIIYRNATLFLLGMIMLSTTNNTARSDEGMWLFNRPPVKLLKDKYNFDVKPEWMDHIQKSSVRFNSGGSGEFVSSNGLVMTNHHVGADSLQKLSPPGKDYIKTGFYAKTQSDELKCVDLELNVLMTIEDVTDKVNAAVKAEMSSAESQKARRSIMSSLEKDSLDKTGLRSDVVTLYQGGQYHLYCYKKYTDIRLVFAPEKDIAFFGGDPDNFEYPRYDLDICFFRVYENDKPAKIEHFLKWSASGAGDGELTFVSGHPGRTDRGNTIKHLEYLRDVSMPLQLNHLRRKEILLKNYADRSLENLRQAQEELFGIQNSRKARLGGLAGLQDPTVFAQKRAEEKTLRDAVAKDSQLKAKYEKAWDDIGETLTIWKEIQKDYNLIERGAAFSCEPYGVAHSLVRLAAEKPKPNGERLREFRESNLESLYQELFSDAPIYDELEIAKLADSLGFFMEQVGADDPTVIKVLAGKSPQERAAQLVRGTKVKDVAVRKKLADGGQAAIDAANDPMIDLVKMIDARGRELRKTYEEKIEEPQRQAYSKIAQARFAILGENQYPDATFTLRLAFGVVKGYTENGKQVPPWTTMGGTYTHAEAHGNVDPFALPKLWQDRKNKLKLDTPFNFVSTADIIGGNSGSPVVNRAGELVGIIFDGNIQSLVLDFAFTEEQARAVAVHSSAIVEALRKIYDAEKLADELGM